MRTLAHFRPVEDNEKNKVPNIEPLNSRNNKLLCESAVSMDELLTEKRVQTACCYIWLF